jgi:hypothetical protein
MGQSRSRPQETAALAIFVFFVVPRLEDCCADKDHTLVKTL